jgi:putative hydrolase of the HAD superfamily
MGYKNVFIDLDRTLWDFETNSAETFIEIFHKYNIDSLCEFDKFHKTYREINDKLWSDYRSKQITKELLSWHRFYLTNKEFGLDDESISKQMGEDYINISPTKTKLFPYSVELLEYISSKYNLYLVTNGFKEVQYLKIKNCNIEKYFDKVFTSEEVGCNKPNREYFEFVLENTGSTPKNSIIIGDDIEVDIKGAAQLGIDTLWFNNNNEVHDFKPSYEVKSLKEITEIL